MGETTFSPNASFEGPDVSLTAVAAAARLQHAEQTKAIGEMRAKLDEQQHLVKSQSDIIGKLTSTVEKLTQELRQAQDRARTWTIELLER